MLLQQQQQALGIPKGAAAAIVGGTAFEAAAGASTAIAEAIAAALSPWVAEAAAGARRGRYDV